MIVKPGQKIAMDGIVVKDYRLLIKQPLLVNQSLLQKT
jgi:hypothetical protein